MQVHRPDPVKPTKRCPAVTLGAVLVIALCATSPAGADENGACPGSAAPAKTPCCPASGGEGTEARGEASAKAACPVDQLQKIWGIEIASLRLSARGYFVDFRYKVTDPAKAAPLTNREWKPYLIDQVTGEKLLVPSTPKLGSLRQTAQQLAAGRTYYILFGNSRGVIKAGNKVTVVVGDCRIENLTVE